MDLAGEAGFVATDADVFGDGRLVVEANVRRFRTLLTPCEEGERSFFEDEL